MASALSLMPGDTGGPPRKGDQEAPILRGFKSKLDEDDSYISYFNERIRIEQVYLDLLTRLHTRTSQTDIQFDTSDPPRPPSTARMAWAEVRDYTLREVESRQAFINAMREDVIAPLSRVRDTQTRTHTRIREDLKVTKENYEEFANSKVPKLKRTYMKAAQSYVDAKKQADAIILQAKLLSEQSPAPSYTERPHPYSQWSNTSGVNLIPENIDTNLSPAPSPVPSPRAVENAQSISGRARSGSGSLTAKEFAAHGKRGFNAIRQRLAGDRENLQPEAQQAAMQNAQSKISKTKSETEQADAAYRKGVFEGESHRMQRERVQQSAVTSLIEFHDELNKVLRRSLTSYKDAVNATAATLAQSTGEIDAALIAIRPDPDTMLYRSVAPKPRTNPPLVYENFWHGPSHSLIFGVKLEDYENARGTGGDRGNPPLIVEKCIAELDIHLSTPGLYRLNGRDATVKDLIQQIESNEELFQFSQHSTSPNDVTAVLKHYLSSLPEPLFPLSKTERVKYLSTRGPRTADSFLGLRRRLRRLQPIQQTTLQTLFEHLNRVANRSQENRMNAKNLAMVFAPWLFGKESSTVESPDSEKESDPMISMRNQKQILDANQAIIEDIISEPYLLFNSPSPAIQEPPLSLRSDYYEDETARPTRPQAHRAGSRHAQLTFSSTPSPTAVDDQSKTDVLKSEVIGGGLAFTPDEALSLLFEPALIPETMRTACGSDLHVRPLASDDFMRSHFGLLSTLSEAPPLAPSVYTDLFHHLKDYGDVYFVCVFIDRSTDQLVASGTLIREKKFIHGGGVSGHIEDIVLSPSVQGRGLGRVMVEGLRELAVGLDCYKVILDCQEGKVPFYEKCGFNLRGRQMAYYVPVPEPVPTIEVDANETLRPEDGHVETESLAETDNSFQTTNTGVTYHFPTTPDSSGTETPGLNGVDRNGLARQGSF